jgi:hypothetical protein
MDKLIYLFCFVYAVAQQLKLIQMMARQLALTVGRGMFTLATDIDAYVFGDDSGDRLSIMTEPVYVPPLCLQGKLVGANTSISIDPEKMGSSVRIAQMTFSKGFFFFVLVF